MLHARVTTVMHDMAVRCRTRGYAHWQELQAHGSTWIPYRTTIFSNNVPVNMCQKHPEFAGICDSFVVFLRYAQQQDDQAVLVTDAEKLMR